MAKPTASIASPIAATWAWYQVVLSCAAYQKTVPNAKNAVAAMRTAEADRQRPSIHQQIPTSSAARPDEHDLAAGREPEDRHERHEDDRRQRRERDQPAGTPSIGGTGSTSW
jgi:hypothetical protein